VVDVMLYGAKFQGMKLAGIVILAAGFIIVLFPENWPDAIQHVVR
jgi:solute carrier family 35 protein F3/4